MTSMKFRLSPPEAGWLSVRLELDGTVFEQVFSYTPVDFVGGITAAIASLTEGRRTAFVEASAEDLGRYAFDFEELPSDRIRLTLLHWPQWSSTRSGGSKIFDVERPRMPLLRAFWRGLQELRGRCTAAEFEREWRRPMPIRELDQLGERLRERR